MAMSPLEVAIVQCYNNSYCLEILKEGNWTNQSFLTHFSLSHSNLPHSVPIIYLFLPWFHEDLMIGESADQFDTLTTKAMNKSIIFGTVHTFLVRDTGGRISQGSPPLK